jgi:hypothetical protein
MIGRTGIRRPKLASKPNLVVCGRAGNTDHGRIDLGLGFFQGGMPLFLADMIAPKEYPRHRRCQPSDDLKSLVERSHVPPTIELVGGETKQIREKLDPLRELVRNLGPDALAQCTMGRRIAPFAARNR